MASLAEGRDVLLLPSGPGSWGPLSDEQFNQRVVRLALCLKEGFGIGRGDVVAISAELCQEWLLADLAVLSLGALSMAIEPDVPALTLQRVLLDTRPRLLFASESLLSRLPPVSGHPALPVPVVAFGGRARRNGPVPFAAVLDAGGVLDTPRRSRALRQAAWEVDPDTPACCHYIDHLQGQAEYTELSQAEVLERITGYWLPPPRPGEKMYVAGPTVTLRTRLALYATIGDGYGSLVLGTRGQELEEIRHLRPERVVAPPSLFAEAMARAAGRGRPRVGGLRGWFGDVFGRVTGGGGRTERRQLKAALGGRVRWVAPTEPLESGVAARLSTIATVGPLASGRPSPASVGA